MAAVADAVGAGRVRAALLLLLSRLAGHAHPISFWLCSLAKIHLGTSSATFCRALAVLVAHASAMFLFLQRWMNRGKSSNRIGVHGMLQCASAFGLMELQ